MCRKHSTRYSQGLQLATEDDCVLTDWHVYVHRDMICQCWEVWILTETTSFLDILGGMFLMKREKVLCSGLGSTTLTSSGFSSPSSTSASSFLGSSSFFFSFSPLISSPASPASPASPGFSAFSAVVLLSSSYKCWKICLGISDKEPIMPLRLQDVMKEITY